MAETAEQWGEPSAAVGAHIEELNRKRLAAYRENPADVEEHANAERIQTEGGYGRRQVWELIQNGADEMLDHPGRVEVVLTSTHLYCANQGNAVTPEGAGAILSAYRSSKKGPEIGRFGLGFKSVLGVTTTPEFFSRTGSFGFSPRFARELIEGVLGKVAQVPTLRLAMALDAGKEANSDPLLASLMSWATSVVRLPLIEDKGEWLHADLGGFPAQFLVFSPHIAELVLDDRVRGNSRRIRLANGAQPYEHRLVEDDREDVWRVFSQDFKPTAAASKDGGAMADRQTIRLQWAVPVKSQARIGGLWAYFPTLEETTLSGVINAPWKLNDDRTRVIEGPFNREILEHAGDLVLEHLETLVDKEDPGNILDILPARGREDRNWADAFLTDRLNTQAALHPSIPDQSGELDLPARMTLHPAKLSAEALKLWSRVPTRPVDWAHRTVSSNQTRRSRAERFFEASKTGKQATLGQWLQVLIPSPEKGAPPNVQASGHAILAAAAAAADTEFLERARAARIVFDEDGELATPSEVFLPGSQAVTISGIRLVHRALAGHQKARAALQALGVRAVDAELELRTLLADRRPRDLYQDWDTLWQLARRVPAERAVSALSERGFTADTLRVRVVSGRFLPIVATLLPGDIVRGDAAPDVVVDIDHHREHLQLLRMLGAVTAPSPGGASDNEPAMRLFREAAIEEFLNKAGKGSKPAKDKIVVAPGQVAGPLTPLESLEGAAKAKYTKALLDAQPRFVRCEVSYPNNRYPTITVEHPVLATIRRNGLIETTSGLVGPELWVGPMLRIWAQVLPVATIPPAAAEALKLPEGLEDLSAQQWETAFQRLISHGDVELASRFYAVACRAGAPRPETLLALTGEHVIASDADEVRVTSSARTASVLRAGSCPILQTPQEDVEELVARWGLRRGDDDISSEVVAIENGPPTPLVDMFPALRPRLDDRQRELQVTWCSEVRVETSGAGGRESETTLLHIDDGVVYVDEALDHPSLLRRLSGRLGLGLDDQMIEKIIENKLNQEIRKRIVSLRKQKSDPERLALVVSADDLRAALPAPLLTAVANLHGEPDHAELARLAFAVYGVETLKTFVEHFDELGLQPPSAWSGSRQAVDFVRGLGFGLEHAGFPGARRASVLEVDGPPGLNELHPYQRAVVDEIHRVLDPAEERPRGMVSLPTGAGKTRVAIQALVESMCSGTTGSPVLWVAQRDELCEQAVQAWSEIWRDRGPRERLTISRLWGTNEAEPVAEGTQVVVATIAKLDSRVMHGTTYDWLTEATCIVIDEAHGAIGPSYTHLLEWQGMNRRKQRVPLLGLTATPYRGMNEEETKALVNRFGNRRLDTAAFGDKEPYRELQDMGVLSRVEHRTLKGADIRLTEREIAEVTRTRLMPSTASDRLAADVDRNTVLLESIQEHPDDWTSLVFCASLEHASVMAGLLTAQGIPSAAVSGVTPPAARRHYIEEFRDGRLRVLTNYAVFAAGFDAPMVRSVYVARPTYSPNVYQQMIGRGLRGPLNGGSEECLIVNVEDNVENFDEQLAFRHFEHLWKTPAA